MNGGVAPLPPMTSPEQVGGFVVGDVVGELVVGLEVGDDVGELVVALEVGSFVHAGREWKSATGWHTKSPIPTV